MNLYESGPDGQPDAQPVTVKVPMIASDDAIPPGTWLAPIFQFTAPSDQFGNSGGGDVYYCQPPVWMP